MKRKNLIIICFSALLFLAAAAGAVLEQKWSKLHSISVDVVSEGGVEEVNLWMGPGEMYYLFLPGYADLSSVRMQTSGDSEFLIDGTEVSDGASCAGYSLDQSYSLVMRQGSHQVQKELVFVKTGQMPVRSFCTHNVF